MNERINGSKVKHEYQRNDEWMHEWFYWIDEYECERNNKCEINNERMHEWFYS